MNTFLGDTPLRVAVRLLILSLVVGWVLNWLNLTPFELFDWAVARVQSLIDLSVDGFGRFGSTIMLGAFVVVPVFLLSRLLNYRRG